MGKYSENPIDNIQGYLDNIEMMLEKHAKAPAPSTGSSELEAMREELSSIKSAIDEIRKDNGLISASMNTVAEAIGTLPTEDERKQQHQEDLQYIINNTKKQVTVDLNPSTRTKLDNISGGIYRFESTVKNAGDIVGKQISDNASKLSEPLDKLAATFETRIGRVVEKKAGKATDSITASIVENWCWRVMALTSLIVWCLTWLYPKIQEIDFPNGIEGFAYSVFGIIGVLFFLYGIYRWGKMNGNGWY